jgi:replicative DNA helicase
MRRVEGGTQIGLSTGLPDLDRLTGGVRVGGLVILAGRPSMGKSALARTIAATTARSGAGGVHVFSLEDGSEDYALRQVADDARIDLERLSAGRFESGEAGGAAWAVANLRGLPWLVDSDSGISAQEIASRVRRHKRELNTKLVVVDYVQLLVDKRIPRHEKRLQVDVASEDLRTLAAQEGVAIVLISQLSRKVDERPNKRPILSDLRESGGLEQIADQVLFCYRGEYYEPDNAELHGLAEIIVRKNKHGRSNFAVDVAFDNPTATFRPLAHHQRSQMELGA